MNFLVSRKYFVMLSNAHLVRWQSQELKVVTRWCAKTVGSSSAIFVTKGLMDMTILRMDSVNSSHKKRFNNGRRGWIPAGLWLRFMLNFFRIMLIHVPIVVNSTWRLAIITTFFAGHAKCTIATCAERLWGAVLSILDQKVASSTQWDSCQDSSKPAQLKKNIRDSVTIAERIWLYSCGLRWYVIRIVPLVRATRLNNDVSFKCWFHVREISGRQSPPKFVFSEYIFVFAVVGCYNIQFPALRVLAARSCASKMKLLACVIMGKEKTISAKV